MYSKLDQKLLIIFFLGFSFNFLWELLHSRFYVYAYIQDVPVTIWALLFSTFGDAIYTLIVAFLFIIASRKPRFVKAGMNALGRLHTSARKVTEAVRVFCGSCKLKEENRSDVLRSGSL